VTAAPTALALVTGAPGWLGTRLVDVLLHGMPEVTGLESATDARPVRCLVRADASSTDGGAPPFAQWPRVEVCSGDLRDVASVEAFCAGAAGATLFHVAGVIHPTQGMREFVDVNVEGTRRLVEAARGAGVRRFVHVSSNSPLGTNPLPTDTFDEGAPYRPYMGYGKSKRAAEEIVRAAGEGGAFDAVIIRPPWFYGPGQPARQDLFFSMIRRGKAPLVGSGANRRSMAYVDNICQGLLLCERVDRAKNNTYWIADRRPYPMTEIIDTIERVLERDFGMTVAHKRMRLPGFASEVALAADATLQAVGLYHQKIHVLSEMNKTIACSIAKAERELGYDPKIELEEGMRRSVASVLDRGGVI
jgi:nucleoside-diphosphate-sugar epimerase